MPKMNFWGLYFPPSTILKTLRFRLKAADELSLQDQGQKQGGSTYQQRLCVPAFALIRLQQPTALKHTNHLSFLLLLLLPSGVFHPACRPARLLITALSGRSTCKQNQTLVILADVQSSQVKCRPSLLLDIAENEIIWVEKMNFLKLVRISKDSMCFID